MNRKHRKAIGLALRLLVLVLIAMKLTGHIEWSWWWVLLPIWGPLAFGMASMGIAGLLILAATIVERLQKRP